MIKKYKKTRQVVQFALSLFTCIFLNIEQVNAQQEPDFSLRLNAGGGQINTGGELFEADQFFNGGRVYVKATAQVSDLYKSERSAPAKNFQYNIPLANGEYEVKLHFAEIYWGATGGGAGGIGKRVFDVFVEGTLLLNDYDIFAEVGAETPTVKTFDITLLDGVLNLNFDALGGDGVDQPKVSAIEILSNTSQFPPITIEPLANQSNVTGDIINVAISASGGDPAANFSYSISGQPEGVDIESTTGLIFGTIGQNAGFGGPNNDGVHAVNISVAKSGPTTVNQSLVWSIGDGVWSDKNENEAYEAKGESGFVQAGNKFYVIGGLESQNVFSYDYGADSWNDLGEAPFLFNHFQPVAYKGLIWVIGALKNRNYPNDDPSEYVWIFDPTLNTWTQGPAVPQDRIRGSAGLVVHNDKFYVVGGSTNGHNGGFVPWLDEFDPLTGQWRELPDAPRPRDHFYAVQVNNKIYAIGGRLTGGIGGFFGPDIAEVDVFDLINESWSTLPTAQNLPTPRAGAPVAFFQDKIMVMGGEIDTGNVYGEELNRVALQITEGFDINSNSWSRLTNTVFSRHGTNAIVSGEAIYLASGASGWGSAPAQQNMEYYGVDAPAGQPLIKSELVVPSSLVFSGAQTNPLILETANGNTGLFVSSMDISGPDANDFSLQNGALVNGLLMPNTQHNLLVEYTGNSNNATAILTININTTDSITILLEGPVENNQVWNDKNENENYIPRHECAFVQAGNKFYLIGGRETSAVEVYDYATDSWATSTPSPVNLNHFQAVEYQGLIWAIGALVGENFPLDNPADHIWIFDPAHETWIQGPVIPQNRRRGAAGMVLYNNKFYIVGGSTNGHSGGFVPWFDEYDPATGIWTALGDAPNARDHFYAALVGDKLYAFGGRQTNPNPNVYTSPVLASDVYDFMTNTWSTLPESASMPTSRSGAPVAIYDDKIVVIGGGLENTDVYGTMTTAVVNITEWFDPITQTWTRGADTNHVRRATQAIVSGNGIFVLSGSDVLLGGTQKNMEFFGEDNPQGVALIPSEMSAPSEVQITEGSSVPILLTASNGNTGVVISSMEISGADATDFSIVNGQLSNGLISANSNHEVTINYSGAGDTMATLTINYGASSSLQVILNASSESCTWNDLADSGPGRFEALSQSVGDKLYIIGGWISRDPPLIASDKNEIYNTNSNTWSLGAPIPIKVTHMGSTVVGDEIWSVGGFTGNDPGVATNIVQIYNTTTDTWRTGPSLPIPTGSGAMALSGNKLHYFGGLAADRQTDIGNQYVLDLANINAGWATAAPLPNPRNHLSGISVDGIVYAIGGQKGHDGPVQDTKFLHSYNPTLDQWTRLADLPFERSHFEPGTTLHNGKIIIVGGRQVSLYFDEVTQYDPQTNIWTALCDFPEKMLAPTAKVFDDRLIVSGGGVNGFTEFSNATRWLQLDPVEEPTSQWTDKAENENYIGRHENAFVQAGDKFFMFGGRETPKDIDVYDYTSNTWSKLIDSAPFEFNHFQGVEYQGLIWVLGAFEDNNFPNEKAAEHVWAFDPNTENWTQGPEIPLSRRRGSTGLVVHNDRFYLIGGNTNGHEGGFVAFFDEYDPATGSWIPLTDAPRARDHFNAIIISSKLYVSGGRLTSSVGGYFSSTISEVDVYDFSSKSWSTLPANQNIPTERAGAAAVNFNNNLVVIGGEIDGQIGALSTTEQYDPTSGIWTQLPDLNSPRHGTQAIVSGNGIYIASGSPFQGGGNQKNMEVLGVDAPLGVPSVSSTLVAPNSVTVASSFNSDVSLTVGIGNIGIFITSMIISGTDASNFTIESGELTNGLIKVNTTHVVSIGFNGLNENASAILTVNYGKESQITVPLIGSVSALDRFTLVDADNDIDLFEIIDGQQISTLEVQGIGLNVRANTVPEIVGSVSFQLSGALNVSRTENAAVYALFGNSGNDYASTQFPLGDYTLSATAYSGANLTGTILGSKTIEFSIVTDNGGNTAPEVTNPGTQNDNEGDTISLQILAVDNSANLTYDATGLPPGLSINQNTGLITGTVSNGGSGSGFQESNGLVLVETESGNTVPGWTQTNDGGTIGIRANTDHFNTQNGGTIPYEVNISTPGVYRFTWRSFFMGSSPTDANDSWLRFPNNSDVWFFGFKGNPVNEANMISNLQGAQTNVVFPKGSSRITASTTPKGSGNNGYLKVFRSGGTSQAYSWQAFTNDGNGHEIYVWFVNPGTYTMEVSERSAGHTIDKIALYKLDGQQYSDGQLTAASESPFGGGPGAASGSPYSVEVITTDEDVVPLSSSVDFIWNIGTSTQYALTVNNGTGDGLYPLGAVVNIISSVAPSGKEFDLWTGDVSGIVDVNSSSTTMTMSSSNATITASYRDLPSGGVIWLEDFENLSNGAISDNGATAWTSSRPIGKFEVSNGAFLTTEKGSIPGIWISEVIPINGTISLSMDVDDGDDNKETNDFVRAYYIVDGGQQVLFGSVSDDISAQTFSASGISGNTIQIVVEAVVSFTNEFYYIDNITVTQDGVSGKSSNISPIGPIALDVATSSQEVVLKASVLKDIYIFPNPTSVTMGVKVSNLNPNILNIGLYELTGKLVRRYDKSDIVNTRDGVEIPIEGIRNGVYMLQIDFENVETRYFKAVIQN